MIKLILWFFLVYQSIEQVVSNEKPKKCLYPNFEANYTVDGLQNCTCKEGYEFDNNYGICFQNRCKLFCGEMVRIIKNIVLRTILF